MKGYCRISNKIQKLSRKFTVQSLHYTFCGQKYRLIKPLRSKSVNGYVSGSEAMMSDLWGASIAAEVVLFDAMM